MVVFGRKVTFFFFFGGIGDSQVAIVNKAPVFFLKLANLLARCEVKVVAARLGHMGAHCCEEIPMMKSCCLRVLFLSSEKSSCSQLQNSRLE